MTAKTSSVSPARSLHHLACGECGWTISILAETSAPLRQCPWCGWDDLDISLVERQGAGQHLRCAEHGAISVQVLGPDIAADDFPDDLFCPFCKRS